MRHTLRAAGAVVVAIVAGCSESDRRVEGTIGTTSQAIQNGDPDGATHPFAVGVCAGRGGNAASPCQGYCSGALILPNLVVTARHCVSQSPREIDCKANPPIRFGGPSSDPTKMWITTSNEMKNNPSVGWHHVKSILVPGGADEDIFCGNDISLLILDDVVASSEAVPAIPNVQYSMSDPKFSLHQFTAIGYGGTKPDDFPSVGTRRIRGGIPILCIPGDPDIPCPTAPGFAAGEFFGGTGTCGGDSGSSSYDQTSFKKGVFISFGVLSRGNDSADGTACQGSAYTRLDKWRDFIIDGANQASSNWTKYGKPSPDWTGPFVPPPPVPDGGTTSGGPRPPGSKAPNGEKCVAPEECSSGLCADGVCAQACNESDNPTTCQDGFECKQGACFSKAGPGGGNGAGGSTTTTTSGCSAAPERASGGGGLFLAVGAAILAISRRRKAGK